MAFIHFSKATEGGKERRLDDDGIIFANSNAMLMIGDHDQTLPRKLYLFDPEKSPRTFRALESEFGYNSIRFKIIKNKDDLFLIFVPGEVSDKDLGKKLEPFFPDHAIAD